MPERSAKMACVLEAPLRMSVLSVSAAGRALPDLGPRWAPLSGGAGSGPGAAPGAGAVRAAGPRSFPLPSAPQLLLALVSPLRGARSVAAEAPALWTCRSLLTARARRPRAAAARHAEGPALWALWVLPFLGAAEQGRGSRARSQPAPARGLCRCRNRGSLLRQGGAAVLGEL